MSATDGDRKRAAALVLALRLAGETDRVAAIAWALADERERARAPFLALAEELDEAYPPLSSAAGHAYEIADRLRTIAAEDPS